VTRGGATWPLAFATPLGPLDPVVCPQPADAIAIAAAAAATVSKLNRELMCTSEQKVD
jgi:hypothetical protein